MRAVPNTSGYQGYPLDMSHHHVPISLDRCPSQHPCTSRSRTVRIEQEATLEKIFWVLLGLLVPEFVSHRPSYLLLGDCGELHRVCLLSIGGRGVFSYRTSDGGNMGWNKN